MRTLLSGEQERQLAAFVQPLVELEKVAAAFAAAERRQPSDAEWAAAAGGRPARPAGELAGSRRGCAEGLLGLQGSWQQ